MKSKFLKIFILFFSVVFIISLLNIVRYRSEVKNKELQFENLQSKVAKTSETISDVQEQKELKLEAKEKTNEQIEEQNEERIEEQIEEPIEIQEEPEPLIVLPEYEELYSENEDLIGWIKIEDTVINYPVMQTIDEPTFYIHRDWEKNESFYGLPLIDARCTLESENIIIYSHNMKDDKMFGSLEKYCNESFYENHQIIQFDTIYEKAEYQIVAVFLGKVYYDEQPQEGEFIFYNYTNMNEEEFQEYIENVKEESLYDTGETAEYGDQLITLCTCHYHVQNGRLLVVAKKIQ